jgi:dTDP-4-amino-4,6-dideoxygalactose transaminase
MSQTAQMAVTQTGEAGVETPVREEFLPFNQPDIDQDEINEVVDTLRSGWITTGPRTKEFERRFAAYVGARHAIAVNSCTGGLHVALAAAGIGPGDEVVVPTMTFCATANVVVHLGATPILVDVELDTLNIDPTCLEAAITPRTKAVIPVHLYGHPCAMDRLGDIAEAHDLLVIEDAAHAVGAKWRGQRIGSISAATAFSFYATKNLTTAEGGMITTDDDDYAERMRIWSLHGISRDAWKRYSAEGSWYYEVSVPGFKYNLTDLQAALGLHQLSRLEDMTRRRTDLAARYRAGLSGCREIELPSVRPGIRHAWHLYPIRLRTELLTISRAQFIGQLKAEGIGTSVHFIPLHRHPYYRERFEFQPQDFPVADAAYKRLISLPLYTQMTESDVEDVIEAVRRVVRRNRRSST